MECPACRPAERGAGRDITKECLPDNTQSARRSNAVRERAGTLASAGKFWY
jgi:hypothetical protein